MGLVGPPCYGSEDQADMPVHSNAARASMAVMGSTAFPPPIHLSSTSRDKDGLMKWPF